MEILTKYVRKALDAGIIDEWHIWDFTRSADDHDWVTQEFGPVRFMNSLVPYMDKGRVSSAVPFRMEAAIASDLHIAVLPANDPQHFYEIVVGGWENQQSVLRKLPRSELASFERNGNGQLWLAPTPGVLSSGTPNQVVLKMDANGVPALHVNNVLVGEWPDLDLTSDAAVMVRGGWGSDLEICDVRAPVRRYVGQPYEKAPYYRSYDFYTKRLSQYSDAVFLKCDDDIVYMNLDKLGAFINHRRENPQYLVTSANVVNNGVCAHWQQAAGAIPSEVGDFEMPAGGYGGTLWLSAERATALHDFFLQTPDKHLPLPAPVMEWKERLSINFIAWLGKDLIHMAIGKLSDEKSLTVDLPAFLNRQSAVFSDFTVSHLSFSPQERGLDVDRLIGEYEDLMRETLAL
jgi:hypothetical protein